jgi:hypothetical protein
LISADEVSTTIAETIREVDPLLVITKGSAQYKLLKSTLEQRGVRVTLLEGEGLGLPTYDAMPTIEGDGCCGDHKLEEGAEYCSAHRACQLMNAFNACKVL